MSDVTRRIPRKGRGREELLRELCEHVLCAPCTTQGLARRLGVSVPTVSRLLVRVRKRLAARGAELVSVRSGRAWHYEIREAGDPAWASFARLKGLVKAPSAPPPGGIDDVVYTGR